MPLIEMRGWRSQSASGSPARLGNSGSLASTHSGAGEDTPGTPPGRPGLDGPLERERRARAVAHAQGAGIHRFICTFHAPEMKQTIVVKR